MNIFPISLKIKSSECFISLSLFFASSILTEFRAFNGNELIFKIYISHKITFQDSVKREVTPFRC